MLTDQQVIAKYGEPGDPDNLTVIALPYPMRIAWDLSKTVTKIQCHKLVADKFLNVFNDIFLHYGYNEIKRLGIDIFGGCFNFRKMRGGNRWSRHSWAIAVDLYPQENGLHREWKDALFSKKEYQFMVDTFYKYGFFSYGKDRNFDAMHFEINE